MFDTTCWTHSLYAYAVLMSNTEEELVEDYRQFRVVEKEVYNGLFHADKREVASEDLITKNSSSIFLLRNKDRAPEVSGAGDNDTNFKPNISP
ncbi:MAG: hypothetical protein P1U74_02675 [Legionellaceae bacterium]|nr:hypothetical protein [Legionellaceae bacterium]